MVLRNSTAETRAELRKRDLTCSPAQTDELLQLSQRITRHLRGGRETNQAHHTRIKHLLRNLPQTLVRVGVQAALENRYTAAS
jgi:hypothetical protein